MKIYDAKLRCSRTGFTLLEILLGGVILAVISMNVYRGFENFSRAGVRAQDRMIAMSLTNTLFEQIKREVDAQPNLFDQITTLSTDWVAIDVPNYPQGYYESRVIARPNTPHAGIAQVVVEIRWQDQSGVMAGRARNVFTMAEPGQFVFGNITGTVYDCRNPDDHIPIANATVRIHQAPPGLEWIIGTITQTDATGTYSFRSQDNRNILPIGPGYRLMGVSPGLRSMISPAQSEPAIHLPEVPDIEQDICLFDANVAITGRLIQSDNAQAIAGKSVSLFREGQNLQSVLTNNQGNFQFTLTEDDGMEDLEPGEIRCFTVATGGPTTAEHNWQTERSFPFWHLYANRPGFVGNFCGSYDRRGWSSAVMGSNPLNPSCDGNRPWFGNASSENSSLNPIRSICVSIGTNAHIGNIPLDTVDVGPIIRVNATIVPNDGELANQTGTVWVSWLSESGSGTYRSRSTTITGNSFYREIPVPAVNLFLPPGRRRMQVCARVTERRQSCCGAVSNFSRSSCTTRTITPGQNIVNRTITLQGGGVSCGGAYGNVYSLLPDVRPISSGSVSSGVSVNFSANGNWRIECPDGTLDRLSRGTRVISFSHSNFYSRSSSSPWPYQSIPHMNIQGEDNFTRRPVNNPDGYAVGLYPIGRGNVSGRVVGDEGIPLSGATARFFRYGSSHTQTRTTDSDGNFTFTNRYESWPPNNNFTSIPEDVRSEMTSSSRRHTIEITATVDGQTQTVTVRNVRVDADTTRNLGNIEIFFPSEEEGGGI